MANSSVPWAAVGARLSRTRTPPGLESTPLACRRRPKCGAPPSPRQFGEGEPVVFARDIVPKTLALFLKRSTKSLPSDNLEGFRGGVVTPGTQSYNALHCLYIDVTDLDHPMDWREP